MAAGNEVDKPELQWVRQDFGIGWEKFELRSFGKPVGILNCSYGLTESAQAEAQGRAWKIEPDGILRNLLRIMRQSDGDLVATYETRPTNNPVRGILRFGDGHELLWLKERSTRDSWKLTTQHGTPVVHFAERVQQGSVAALDAGSESQSDLSLLMMLGFYLRRLSTEEEQHNAAREERHHRR